MPRAHPRAPYYLLIPVLMVGFLPGPVLLGQWESMSFYHAFGAVDAPLSFLIAPRANIGGQGYALLEMARPIITALDLPLTLATFRIPAVFFGIASLLLFFTICRRYFGAWPALGATALLAGNQVFFQTEHMMTVLVISGAALLFLLERLQALEVRYWNVKAWIGASLAMVLVALHYGIVRIFAVMLIGLWLVKVYWLLRKTPGSASIQAGIAVLAGYSIAAFLFVLTVLDYRNLISVVQFPKFLFPEHSEIAVLQYSSGTDGVPGFLSALEINLRIFAESILGSTGDFHSPYATYVFADFRYPLLDWFVVPIATLGLIVALGNLRRRTAIFATPWGNILALLAVFSLPVLFSLVLVRNDVPFATLSVNRMYFCLIPLHMLVAALLAWLGASGLSRTVRYAAAFCVAAAFAVQIFNLIGEHARFEAQVFAADWQKHGPESRVFWDDRAPNRDRQERYFISHLQQHAQYAIVARQLAGKLRERHDRPAGENIRRIVFVDVNRFSEAPTAPAQLHYIVHRNFHAIFLALYAGQEGAKLNPVVMVDPARRPISPNLMAGLAYMGKPREYSALMDLDQSGRLSYRNAAGIVPVVVNLAGKSAYDILVTTPEEEAGARSLLEKQKIPFKYVRI